MPMCNIHCLCPPSGRSAFDCSRSSVWAGIAVALLEFFPSADSLKVDNAVDGENSVEVVDLVLQQLGEIMVITGIKFENFAVQVLITHADLTMAFDLHKDRKETQAGVPDDDFLFAAPDDFRIDDRPRLGVRKLEDDDSVQHADLGSRDAASIAAGGPPIRERVGQVPGQLANVMRGGVFHAAGLRPQMRSASLGG